MVHTHCYWSSTDGTYALLLEQYRWYTRTLTGAVQMVHTHCYYSHNILSTRTRVENLNPNQKHYNQRTTITLFSSITLAAIRSAEDTAVSVHDITAYGKMWHSSTHSYRGIGWGFVTSFTPRPFYPWERGPGVTVQSAWA